MKKNERLHELLGIMSIGYGTREEVGRRFCEAQGLTYPSGSFNRLWASVQAEGLVITKNINVFGQGAVQLVRLSSEGMGLCGKAEIAVRDSEWGLLVAGHRGEQLPKHTAMILMFAQHARMHGYRVGLLPRTRYVWEPDLSVQRGTEPRIYVEVETRARFERVVDGKWARALEYCRRLDARLGIVMLRCAARDRLAEWAPGALVTDLQSLCRDQQEGLWSVEGAGR